jgi:hypothetical protein
MRWCAGIIRRCVALIALACTGGTAVVADHQQPYRQSVAVCIQLTDRDGVSGPAFRTLRDEATRIWLPHGIALVWTQPSPIGCGAVVPVFFDDRLVRQTVGPDRRNALAVTVFSGRARIIYVSAPRAYAMLAVTREVASAPVGGGQDDFRKGILLGRVVAHELGHALLQTMSHSDSGLMRPVFGAHDALSDVGGVTDLSAADESRLATRFALVPANTPPAAAVLARSER